MNRKFISLVLIQIVIIAENPDHVQKVKKAIASNTKPFQDPSTVAQFRNPHQDPKNCICYNCDFSHGNSLKGMNLQGCVFEGSTFEGADLEGTKFIGTDLNGTNFKHANLKHSDFSSANAGDFLPFPKYQQVPMLSKVRDSRPELRNQPGADFGHADLRGSKFVNSKFQNSIFSHAKLDGSVLLYAQLQGSHFNYASAVDTRFKGTNLEGTKLQHMQPTNILDEAVQSRLIYTGGYTNPKNNAETFQMPAPINFCGTVLPNGEKFSIYNSATCTNEQMAKHGDYKHMKVN